MKSLILFQKYAIASTSGYFRRQPTSKNLSSPPGDNVPPSQNNEVNNLLTSEII